MELLKQNLVNTTTAITVGDNTTTVENILLRDLTYQYFTTNFNNDATTASITFTLSAAQPVSRLAILGHNLKGFTVFYDGTTANTFDLTSGPTTVSDYSSNSETSQYLQFTAVTISSITIDMKTTQVANSNKALGYIHFSDVELDFDRIPSASNYTPLYNPKEVVHKISDGGIKLHYLTSKFSAQIKYKYITEAFRNQLFDIWKTKDVYTFVPFGTATSWDSILFNVAWPGRFEFYKYSDNAASSGFSGTISLSEVS